MPKRLNPNNFEKFDEIKDIIENLVIIYSERLPNDYKMEYEGINYSISKKAMSVDLPGQVTDPPTAIYKLALAYEFKSIDFKGKGLLFVYDSFVPQETSSGDVQQLKFQVYRMDIP